MNMLKKILITAIIALMISPQQAEALRPMAAKASGGILFEYFAVSVDSVLYKINLDRSGLNNVFDDEVLDNVLYLGLNEEALKLIIEELLLNAESSGATAIELSIKIRGANLVITASDNHRGIDSVEGLQKKDAGADGIAAVRKYTAEAGGKITYSTGESGTTFTVTLPAFKIEPLDMTIEKQDKDIFTSLIIKARASLAQAQRHYYDGSYKTAMILYNHARGFAKKEKGEAAQEIAIETIEEAREGIRNCQKKIFSNLRKFLASPNKESLTINLLDILDQEIRTVKLEWLKELGRPPQREDIGELSDRLNLYVESLMERYSNAKEAPRPKPNDIADVLKTAKWRVAEFIKDFKETLVESGKMGRIEGMSVPSKTRTPKFDAGRGKASIIIDSSA